MTRIIFAVAPIGLCAIGGRCWTSPEPQLPSARCAAAIATIAASVTLSCGRPAALRPSRFSETIRAAARQHPLQEILLQADPLSSHLHCPFFFYRLVHRESGSPRGTLRPGHQFW